MGWCTSFGFRPMPFVLQKFHFELIPLPSPWLRTASMMIGLRRKQNGCHCRKPLNCSYFLWLACKSLLACKGLLTNMYKLLFRFDIQTHTMYCVTNWFSKLLPCSPEAGHEVITKRFQEWREERDHKRRKVWYGGLHVNPRFELNNKQTYMRCRALVIVIVFCLVCMYQYTVSNN